MKRTDRLEKIEQKVSGIDPEYQPLMQCFRRWQQGNPKDKQAARSDAETFLKDGQRFTKLAYFPPNDVDVAGMVSINEWWQFIKYSFK